jgi:hypothetical protein
MRAYMRGKMVSVTFLPLAALTLGVFAVFRDSIQKLALRVAMLLTS